MKHLQFHILIEIKLPNCLQRYLYVVTLYIQHESKLMPNQLPVLLYHITIIISIYQLINEMFVNCTKAVNIFCSSLEEHGLMEGVSDIIVVRHKSGQYKSTQFFACFGPYAVSLKGTPVQVTINNILINHIKFTIDKYGNVYPTKLNSNDLMKLFLHFGKNKIEYRVEEVVLTAEIYLYADRDRLLVSDVDGTLTKNDIGGLYSNYLGHEYLHDGYHQLINRVSDNGYKIVWMTMRSLPLYQFSKKYIREHVGIEGPLLMEPEEFFHAVKKELMKKTGNIKANIMQNIKDVFPEDINPFIAGLGNRQNDAIAYRHAGIPPDQIYIIDTDSQVHKLDNVDHQLTYKELVRDIEEHFPKYFSPLVGYKSEIGQDCKSIYSRSDFSPLKKNKLRGRESIVSEMELRSPEFSPVKKKKA